MPSVNERLLRNARECHAPVSTETVYKLRKYLNCLDRGWEPIHRKQRSPRGGQVGSIPEGWKHCE
jgi:hypothetical protein